MHLGFFLNSSQFFEVVCKQHGLAFKVIHTKQLCWLKLQIVNGLLVKCYVMELVIWQMSLKLKTTIQT